MWTKEKLQELIRDKVEESNSLEYKAAASLVNLKTTEISKDVSAMANAAGGVIIFGISENSPKRHIPGQIDPIDRNIMSKERLEDIIDSNIRPRIEGIIIIPVEIDDPSKVVYVVEIPQSNTAHQASDRKYYRRRNFKSDPMEDYEIKETINRSKYPLLQLKFRINEKDNQIEEQFYSVFSNQLKGRYLYIWIENPGTLLAKYVRYIVYIPENIIPNHEKEKLLGIGSGTVEYKGNNTVRDIIDNKPVDAQGYSKANIFGSARYEPLLPGTTSRPNGILLMEPLSLDNRAIKWKIYADNAPVREGEIKLSDIETI